MIGSGGGVRIALRDGDWERCQVRKKSAIGSDKVRRTPAISAGNRRRCITVNHEATGGFEGFSNGGKFVPGNIRHHHCVTQRRRGSAGQAHALVVENLALVVDRCYFP